MPNIFKKILKDSRIINSSWMLIERLISLFGLIFVVSSVAKYTGPKIYGEIALAGSIFVVFKSSVMIGLDQIYFKYVSQNKPYQSFFLENAIKLISILYIFGYLLICIISWFFATKTGFAFIVALGISSYFSSIDLLTYFFEGKLLAKVNVLSNIVGISLSLLLRFLIVLFSWDILYLTIPFILLTTIPFFIRLYLYKKNRKYELHDNNLNIRHRSKKARKYYRYFIFSGIPLALVTLSATLNGQIASFVVASKIGTTGVGIYSIAFVLAGAWCIVPTTVITSFLTQIYSINNTDKSLYVEKASRLLIITIGLSISIVLITYLLTPLIIRLLYGPEFIDSIYVMRILLISHFFWVVNFLFSRLILKFNGYKYLAFKSIISLVFNFFLCIILVNKVGTIGAAYAALIVECFGLGLCYLYTKAHISLITIRFFKKN